MHITIIGYGLHLEAWFSRHSGDVSSSKQAQEGELTEIQWILQTTIWKGKASSGSVVGGRGGVGKYGNFPCQGSSVVEKREK